MISGVCQPSPDFKVISMQEAVDGARCRPKAETKMPEQNRIRDTKQDREIASEILTQEGYVRIFTVPVQLESRVDAVVVEFPAATHLFASGGEGSNQSLLVFAETNIESPAQLVAATTEHLARQRKSPELMHVMPGGASLLFLDSLDELVMAPIPK
jgi:hypothetical protein